MLPSVGSKWRNYRSGKIGVVVGVSNAPEWPAVKLRFDDPCQTFWVRVSGAYPFGHEPVEVERLTEQNAHGSSEYECLRKRAVASYAAEERLRNERDAALARAEAAEKRCAELEVATIVCPACCESMTASQAVPVRELVARAEAAEAALESCQRARRAAERRVEELEGALRKIETTAQAESETLWQDGDDFAEISVAFANIELVARAAIASGNGEVSHD